MQIFYVLFISFIVYILGNIKSKELLNALIAFLVIDISNTERKNVTRKQKFYFYNSISAISKSTVCGFIAPIFYILIFNNLAGLIYFFIYNLYLQSNLKILNFLFNITTIIPSIITEAFLYIVYIIRNKRFMINFKGDFFANVFLNPLLNVDIMAAYVESVNFYYHFTVNNKEYLKSYGDYKNRINEVCTKDYLGVSYSICMINFIVFFMINLGRFFNFLNL